MGPIPGIFGNQQSSAPVTNLIGVIVAIKKFHTVVPLSLEEIIESPKYETLETQLGIVKSKIPDTLLLPLESPNDITNILCTNDGSTDGFVVWLNLDVLCSATLLHRPKLYMTSLKCATPRLVLPQVRNKLIKVIDESCAAVFGAKLSSLWYSLLEITISAWFLVCRIQKEWAELVKYDDLEMIEAADLFTEFTRKFMKQAGMIECAVPMMECMLKEMQSCAGRYHPASNESMTASSRRDIEGKNESGGYYAYLGLLGLDIAGGKRWDEGKDDAWRSFWKRNGLV